MTKGRPETPSQVRLVRNPTPLRVAAISDLLASVGMRARDPRKMRRAIQGSLEVIVAYAGREVVGFGRLVSDGVYYGTLWDVAVAPRFQGHGVGRAIVERLLRTARKRKLRMVGLFTALYNRSFYEGLGFTVLEDIHPMTIRTGIDGPGPHGKKGHSNE